MFVNLKSLIIFLLTLLLLINIILLNVYLNPEFYESFIYKEESIPNIIFIVLENHKNRLNNVKNIIKNEHLGKYSLFNAIDGNTLNFDNLNQSNRITRHAINKLKPGVIGCSLSHITVWEKFIRGDTNSLIILEDDIDICNNFNNKVSLLYHNLPLDYDICYLEVRENLDSAFKCKPINKYLMEGAPQYGTIGYIISKKGAQKLIKYCTPIDNAIDIMISNAIKKKEIISYISREDLVFHKYKFKSVVCGKGKFCTPGKYDS